LSPGASPQTPLRSLQCSPYPLAAFKGPTSKAKEGTEGDGKGEEGKRGERGRERKGREGKGKGGEVVFPAHF